MASKNQIKIFAIIIFIFLTGFITGTLVLATNVRPDLFDSVSLIKQNKQDITDYAQCKGKDLQDTANCLVDWERTFYNYTVRPDTDKTLEDIKKNGGDCYDYNLLYEKAAKNLGFSAYFYEIFYQNEGHAFTVIMDKTGYCKLDQTSDPDCFLFADSSSG